MFIKYIRKNFIRFLKVFGVSIGMNALTSIATADVPYLDFPSIDGGLVETKQWHGNPYLVVNTASKCGFTRQYTAMQELYDMYRDDGFVVLAIPSDDFNQELDNDAEVKDFCELNYSLDMPMTSVLSVRGSHAHPFYKALEAEAGYVPVWNFSKVLIGSKGEILGTWGPMTSPMSSKITKLVDAALVSSF
jgi:glutathione peroxidase